MFMPPFSTAEEEKLVSMFQFSIVAWKIVQSNKHVFQRDSIGDYNLFKNKIRRN